MFGYSRVMFWWTFINPSPIPKSTPPRKPWWMWGIYTYLGPYNGNVLILGGCNYNIYI